MIIIHDTKLLTILKTFPETRDGIAILEWIEQSRDNLIHQSIQIGNDHDKRISYGDKAQELTDLLETIRGAAKQLNFSSEENPNKGSSQS